MMRFYNPGALMTTVAPNNTSRNFMRQRGTEARRRVMGADGAIAAIIFAQRSGGYGGSKGNSVYTVLQRVNATPRYVLQFFEADGTQIGSTIVENGTSLNGLATTLASNANGVYFSLTVYNNTNQATADTGNGFANSTKMSGGA